MLIPASGCLVQHRPLELPAARQFNGASATFLCPFLAFMILPPILAPPAGATTVRLDAHHSFGSAGRILCTASIFPARTALP